MDSNEAVEKHKLLQITRFKNSQLVFMSLFTAILALFVIIVSFVQIEENTEKRSYQKLVNVLYQDINRYKKQQNLDWLVVENTLSKGIRLTFNSKVLAANNLFASARAKLNPYFLPYLEQLIGLVHFLDLENYPEKHASKVAKIISHGERLIVSLRVEGHTDSIPLSASALYSSNIELSSFRAYSLMAFIKLYTRLPPRFFAIAGYGSFKPLSNDATKSINRRVEIYIVPNVLSKSKLLK